MPDQTLDPLDTAAVERHRASRARAKAAALRAGGFTADADQLEQAADAGEHYASLIDTLAQTRAVYNALCDDAAIAYSRAVIGWADGGRQGDAPNRPDFLPRPSDPKVLAYKAAQVAVADYRAELRYYGQMAGVRRGVAIVNNTTEV